MKHFRTSDFANAVKEGMESTPDNLEAAKIAYKKAARIAGLMTDESYKIPAVSEFKATIDKNRDDVGLHGE